MHDSIKYWVWLSSIPGIGARKCSQLLEHFEEPERIWRAESDELKKLTFLDRINVNNILDKKYKNGVTKHLENLYKYDVKAVTIKDGSYPYYLKNTYDPPAVLYVRGKLKKDEKTVAVVGSRKATAYGLSIAEKLAYDLSKCGLAVISGMARGIDSYAHKGALKAGGRTIAVLGCGPDVIYPSENGTLMKDIIVSGAVVSEYLPGFPPVPGNFPARNRIISGISLGVVVVEANEDSGSLITADFAVEQGREVFAIPGNVSSRNSVGTNRLIKEGARVVTGIEDILEELNIKENTYISDGFIKNNVKGTVSLKGLDRDERKIIEYLKAAPLQIDNLAKESGLSVSMLSAVLVFLEMKGLIEQMPGKIFKLKI